MNNASGKLVREANSCVSWPYNTTSVDLTPLTPNAHRPTFDQPPPQPPAATCSGSPLSHPRCCAVLHLHGAHTCLWGSLIVRSPYSEGPFEQGPAAQGPPVQGPAAQGPPHRARKNRAPPSSRRLVEGGHRNEKICHPKLPGPGIAVVGDLCHVASPYEKGWHDHWGHSRRPTNELKCSVSAAAQCRCIASLQGPPYHLSCLNAFQHLRMGLSSVVHRGEHRRRRFLCISRPAGQMKGDQ